MTRVFIACALLATGLVVTGCKGEEQKDAPKVVVTKVTGYKPNLPAVPDVPEPSVPETYGDGSFSVYGLRKNMQQKLDSEVDVTAYIVEIYEKPECPEGKTCSAKIPHLFLADEPGERVERRRIRLLGYAQNFKEIEDAKLAAEGKIKLEELPEGVEKPPVVWDWQVGHKYKIRARFTKRSADGSMHADGLLEYRSHQCLDCPEDTESK